MTTRQDGNPNSRRDTQREARIGRDRTPNDFPRQSPLTRRGQQPATAISIDPAGRYQLGPAQRPASIRHDNGFLALGKRAPAAEDYKQLAIWQAKLELAEAVRPDLVDATAAYRHFLQGRGKQRQFSYERYVMSDASGKITLRNAVQDIQQGIVNLHRDDSKLRDFLVTGAPIFCGDPDFPDFPYPATENWQKAIGGHVIWLSGHVKVTTARSGEPQYDLALTLHAEDRYNFNPDNFDIKTGIPDSANGAFEMTGLAHQYDQYAILKRVVTWRGSSLRITSSSNPSRQRERQPAENRRLRNRI